MFIEEIVNQPGFVPEKDVYWVCAFACGYDALDKLARNVYPTQVMISKKEKTRYYDTEFSAYALKKNCEISSKSIASYTRTCWCVDSNLYFFNTYEECEKKYKVSVKQGIKEIEDRKKRALQEVEKRYQSNIAQINKSLSKL